MMFYRLSLVVVSIMSVIVCTRNLIFVSMEKSSDAVKIVNL